MGKEGFPRHCFANTEKSFPQDISYKVIHFGSLYFAWHAFLKVYIVRCEQDDFLWISQQMFKEEFYNDHWIFSQPGIELVPTYKKWVCFKELDKLGIFGNTLTIFDMVDICSIV